MWTSQIAGRVEMPLLIVFLDLTRYAAQALRESDVALAGAVDDYYERVAAAVAPAGGCVVKFIGDGALIVFREGDVDAAVSALLDLKCDIDAHFEGLGWECRQRIKAHFGVAVAGPYGAAGDKRFDVIGKAVNAAALLDTTGVTLSEAAFDRLGPALRERFRVNTSPTSYVRVEDPVRFRPGKQPL